MSGYINLGRTGFAPFDVVLEAIEKAGDAFHHTSQWADEGWCGEKSQLDQINEKIEQAAKAVFEAERRGEEADKRDAARYRYMRTSAAFQNRNGPGLYWYFPWWDGKLPLGERLDASIDRALNKTPNGFVSGGRDGG